MRSNASSATDIYKLGLAILFRHVRRAMHSYKVAATRYERLTLIETYLLRSDDRRYIYFRTCALRDE